MPLNQVFASRYSVTCPVCGTAIHPSQFSGGISTFRCTACGELLEYAPRGEPLLLPVGIVAGAILAFHLGYRGFALVLAAAGAALLIFFLGIFVAFQIRPPKVRQSLKNGDTGLRLTNRPHR